MKYRIIAAVAAAAFSILFPLVIASANPTKGSGAEIVNEAQAVLSTEKSGTEETADTSAETADTSANTSADTSAADVPVSQTGEDASVTVRVLMDDGTITPMTLHDYLIGVVAAEMPATFEPEALKAQAVAARTYTLYKMKVHPSANHPDADVCTDNSCCSAYIGDEELQQSWGDNYDRYLAKITSAVEDTDGIIALYDSKPILAVFHSSSTAMTEDSANVWSQSVPYLKSVASGETADEVNNYVVTVTIAADDFYGTIRDSLGGDTSAADLAAAQVTADYSPSGRLVTLHLGDAEISGTELRSLFDLRSTAMDIQFSDTEITITTTGYGHGVGLSQYGANDMALKGSTYDEILCWYYTDIRLGHISDCVS